MLLINTLFMTVFIAFYFAKALVLRGDFNFLHINALALHDGVYNFALPKS
jgi:hypothetical protein